MGVTTAPRARGWPWCSRGCVIGSPSIPLVVSGLLIIVDKALAPFPEAPEERLLLLKIFSNLDFPVLFFFSLGVARMLDNE